VRPNLPTPLLTRFSEQMGFSAGPKSEMKHLAD
jgi:hypothetical protein